jgi:hypothetical protein
VALERQRPPPDPARAALSRAVERHQAALAELAQLEDLRAKARASCIEAMAAIETAEAVLTGARDRTSQLSYISKVVDAPLGADPVVAAEKKLAAANERYDRARAAEAAVGEHVAPAQSSVSIARLGLDAAVGELVRSSPAAAQLVADHDAAVARVEAFSRAVSEVGLAGTTNRLAVDASIAAAWRATKTALLTDPHAPLPNGVDHA